jgi:hypothetical protein
MLMLAARNGNPDTIKALIAAGAEVNARENIRGTTALMWAVEQSHPLLSRRCSMQRRISVFARTVMAFLAPTWRRRLASQPWRQPSKDLLQGSRW